MARHIHVRAGISLAVAGGLAFAALHNVAVNEAFDAKPGCQAKIDAFRMAQDQLPERTDNYQYAKENYFGSYCPVTYGEAIDHYNANTYVAFGVAVTGLVLTAGSAVQLKRNTLSQA